VACLDEDDEVEIVRASKEPIVGLDAVALSPLIDVAVVSVAAAQESELACAFVVCSSATCPVIADERALAHLPRNCLTRDEIVAAVRAAAAGLRVTRDQLSPQLDERRLRILRLLANGADTSEISERLCYSQRTIKGLIASIEAELGSRNRAQAVATAIRGGLI
jgi:DNA-binding CsgD family transcriptional regulator